MSRKRKSEEPNLFALRCDECRRQLVTTPSGYLACPAGHGRLVIETDTPLPGAEEPCGSLFDVLPHEEN